MNRCRISAAVLALILLAGTPALGQPPRVAGRVKVASGAVFILRQSGPTAAQVGQVLYQGDGLRTGADGRIGVTLNDDTRISLGPGSEVRLDRFVFSPTESRFGLALKIVKGIAAYVSGRIAKLSPDSVRLETPAAIVGIRGTRLVIRVGTP